MSVIIYPEITQSGLDCPQNLAVTTDLKKQIQNAVLARLLDEYWYDRSFGIKLPKLLMRSDPRQYNVIAKSAENEILKDVRIGTCSVFISQPDSRNTVYVKVNVTPINSDEVITVSVNL